MAKKKMTRKKIAQKKTSRKKASVRKQAATARAEGKTQISISLPESLVDKIDKLAAAENRNRSNFISTTLEALAED